MTTSPASSAEPELIARVSANLESLHERIERAGRDPKSVRVLAVTKGFGPAYVHAAFEAGLDAVGENYVDEMCDKRDAVDLALRWHFIGRIQSNKTAKILRCADVIETVSRTREIERLAVQGPRQIFIQVDFTARAERNGAPASDVPGLVARAREVGLEPLGLMTIAPVGDEAGAAFAATRRLADELGLAECSMGMSDDLEAALAHGTTEIRVGRGLFGPRPARVGLT